MQSGHAVDKDDESLLNTGPENHDRAIVLRHHRVRRDSFQDSPHHTNQRQAHGDAQTNLLAERHVELPDEDGWKQDVGQVGEGKQG